MKNKKLELSIHQAEEILKAVLYLLQGDENKTADILKSCTPHLREKLHSAAAAFSEKINNDYHTNFLSQSETNAPCQIEHNKDSIDFYSIILGEEKLSPQTIKVLQNSEEHSIEFLYAFNIVHNIIPEIICRSYFTSDQAAEYACAFTAQTKGPERFSLLAAATESNAVENGYIVKDIKFQSYSLSIFREDASTYAFDFISNHGSLAGKLIHVTVFNPEPVIIEELCGIDTNQYTLYYNGELGNTADIQPAVIEPQNMKMDK